MQLRRRQDATFGAIQAWANGHFGFELSTSDSLFHTEQRPEVSFAYASALEELPYAQLLGVTELAGACKSLLIAFAVQHNQLSAMEVRTLHLPRLLFVLLQVSCCCVQESLLIAHALQRRQLTATEVRNVGFAFR